MLFIIIFGSILKFSRKSLVELFIGEIETEYSNPA